MTRKINRIQLLRRIVLGVMLAVVTGFTIAHQKIASMPSIDALCPFGGIEAAYKFFAGGELLKKLAPSNIVLLVATVVLAVVLSRFFCGWLCAFGALQGAFGWLGKKLFKRTFTVPEKLDRYLRMIKYPLLAVILYFTWRTGTLVIRPYDPFAAYGHLSAGLGEVWAEFAIGFVILVASMLLSMLYERAFCKYLCPLGAFNAILGRIPLFRIKRKAATCISCSKCDKVCPMNIDVSHPGEVKSMECIGCLECVTVCPTKVKSLETTLAGKPVKIGAIVAIGLAIYFGALGIGRLTGFAEFSAPTLEQLAEHGTLKVEDIKGSSTWGQVAESFGVELAQLYREAGVDSSKVPAETRLKDTGALIGADFEADTVRIAVAKILGIPYSGEGGEAKTEESAVAAAAAPASAPVMSAGPATTQPAAAAAPAAAPAKAASPVATAAPAAAAAAAVTPAAAALVVPEGFALEGTMTVAEVAAALKASPAAVIAKLGLPADAPLDKTLREMKDQYGYTMPALKERFAK